MIVQPLQDFLFEVGFGDASQVAGIPDFNHGPVVSCLLERLGVQAVERVARLCSKPVLQVRLINLSLITLTEKQVSGPMSIGLFRQAQAPMNERKFEVLCCRRNSYPGPSLHSPQRRALGHRTGRSTTGAARTGVLLFGRPTQPP